MPPLKPVVLIFIRYYLPGFRSGGPVRSISNIVQALENEYDFYIVCLNLDHGKNDVYKDVTPGQWTMLGKARVWYQSERDTGLAFCLRTLWQIRPDMVYLNSLFDRQFSFIPFLSLGLGHSVPILLAPRGELSPGALGLKAKRKALFLYLVRFIKFYSSVIWHASSSTEQVHISKVFAPDAGQLFLASNLLGIDQKSFTRTRLKKPGVLKIVIVARISPMKNTLTAIRIASQLKGEIELDLWGPMENKKYWAACQLQIQRCPPNITVRHQGEVLHEKLHKLLHGYDLMLMPTLGENFGHSIIEALSAGLPVIISDRTPWKNLMAAGVGADLPLNNETEFVRQLERFEAMGERDMDQVRNVCRRYVSAWQAEHTDLGAYRKMFDTVIASRKVPCK